MTFENIALVALTSGFVAFWGGFTLRRSQEQPAYSRGEIDSKLDQIEGHLKGSDERLERIETKVDRLLENGRGHHAG